MTADEPTARTRSSPAPPEGWVEMQLRGLLVDPNTDTPVVILRQVDGTLYLPIWIGGFDSNAIALALEGATLPRPMTHDLMRSLLKALGAEVERVEVHALIEGTFHARLVLAPAATETGESEARRPTPPKVDARPSDALALALRVGAPIWAATAVLRAAVDDSRAHATETDDKLREWLERLRPEDLGKYEM